MVIRLTMRIKFELENSDIECDFTPDFRVSANYTDETKISWRLPIRGTPINVGVLPPEFSDEISTDTSVPGRSDV